MKRKIYKFDEVFVDSSHVSQKSATSFEYFVIGIGHKIFNGIPVELEVEEILEPIDYDKVQELINVYGVEVVKELLPNNAESWRYGIIRIAMAGDRPRMKDMQKFKDLFLIPIKDFTDFKLIYLTGLLLFDIVKFDMYLSHKFGYCIETDGSMGDFLEKHFGVGTSEWFESKILNGVKKVKITCHSRKENVCCY